MIVIHRITPFFITIITATVFALSIFTSGHPLLYLGIGFVLSLLLFARLQRWEVKETSFWAFVAMPMVFYLASIGAFLLLETTISRVLIGLIVSLLLFFFSENIFAYLHLPAKYQAYSIEYLSLVISVLTIFFLSTIGFGLRLFLQMPLYILTPILFAFALISILSTMWVSKVEAKRAIALGLSGAFLLSELFLAGTFLPIGFYTNAAVVTVFLYVFLGLMRAHALDKLSKKVVRRYLLVTLVLLALLLGTTQWV